MSENKDRKDTDKYRENLPVLATAENTGRERTRQGRRINRGIVISVSVMLCVLITALSLIAAFMNSVPKAVQNADAQQSDEGSEEWRGAFSARNIYEECYQSAVTVRLGRDSDSVCWSGFVIDSDGWIVTMLDMMDTSKRGKIYVTFNDGKEYSVESIWKDSDSGVAVMKISADGLNAVEIREGDIQGGERVICVGSFEYGSSCVSSGEICGKLDDRFKVNIGLDIHGTGAPVFDENGCLVAIATAHGIENSGRISYALSADRCKNVFKYIKDEKNQQNH